MNHSPHSRKPPSVISQLASLQLQHKQINSMLHVLQYKVNTKVPPLQRKQQKSPKDLSKVKRDISMGSDSRDRKTNSSFIFVDRGRYDKSSGRNLKKNSLVEEKIKIQKLKEAIQTNRENKKKEAKEMKEANRLMRENVLLFRDRLLEENIQKKKIVDAKYKLIYSSINNYKNLKRQFIHSTFQDAIDQQVKEISKKTLKLKSLQSSYQVSVMNTQVKANKTFSEPLLTEKDSELKSTAGTSNVHKFLATIKKDQASTFMTGIKGSSDD